MNPARPQFGGFFHLMNHSKQMLCIALHCLALLWFALLCGKKRELSQVTVFCCFALLCIDPQCFAIHCIVCDSHPMKSLCLKLHCMTLLCSAWLALHVIALLCFALNALLSRERELSHVTVFSLRCIALHCFTVLCTIWKELSHVTVFSLRCIALFCFDCTAF